MYDEYTSNNSHIPFHFFKDKNAYLFMMPLFHSANQGSNYANCSHVMQGWNEMTLKEGTTPLKDLLYS